MERVIFCKEGNGILAVFPHQKFDQVGNLTGYDGNHVPVSHSYFSELELVQNSKDYLELKNELLSLGYKLNILNGKPDTILTNTLKTK